MRDAIRPVLFAAIAVLAFGVHASHAAQIVGLSGKCLDVSGGRTSNGAAVDLWPCGPGFPNQRWNFVGEAIVGIGGKCLDVRGGQAVDGAQVEMWECNRGPNQRWHLSDGRIVGIGGKCLDVAGGNSDGGTGVLLWRCHGGENQRWRILPSVIDR